MTLQKPGDFVVIKFCDHSSADGGIAMPIMARVCGWVIEDTSQAITIESWLVEEPADMNANNHLTFCIIKQPGTQVFEAAYLG